MKQFFVSFLLVSIAGRLLLGQPIVNNTTIVPPAPNTAALGQYGSYPVGMYTGTPDINIPLAVVEESGFSLPISLKYHASGIRVNQYATWTGLGWTLHAGGAIARTMRGLPDEMETPIKKGYLYSLHSLFQNDGKYSAFEIYHTSQASVGDYTLINFSDAVILSEFAKNNYDGMPDLFSFNTGNLSGTFVLTPQPYPGPPIVTLSEPIDVKIDIIWINGNWDNRIAGFVVTDNQGVKYTFSQKEKSRALRTANYNGQSFTICNSQDENYDESFYTSGWYLTEILPASGIGLISFEYKQDVSAIFLGRREVKYVEVGSWLKREISDPSQIVSMYDAINTCTPPSDETCYSIQENQELKISKITTLISDQEIVFDSSPDRLDILNSLKLNFIERKINNIIDYRYEFIYDYFNSNSFDNKRLKLLSVEQKHPTSLLTSNPYIFNYDERENLPSLLSLSVDHWGFYNGMQNIGNTLIPSIHLDYGYLNETISGADRSPDITTDNKYLLAGILNKIYYPTGGFTEFEYEANSYSTVGNTFGNGSNQSFSEGVYKPRKVRINITSDADPTTPSNPDIRERIHTFSVNMDHNCISNPVNNLGESVCANLYYQLAFIKPNNVPGFPPCCCPLPHERSHTKVE